MIHEKFLAQIASLPIALNQNCCLTTDSETAIALFTKEKCAIPNPYKLHLKECPTPQQELLEQRQNQK